MDEQSALEIEMTSLERDREASVLQKLLVRYLTKLKANPELIRLASRKYNLAPKPPPGASRIVTTREELKFDELKGRG